MSYEEIYKAARFSRDMDDTEYLLDEAIEKAEKAEKRRMSTGEVAALGGAAGVGTSLASSARDEAKFRGRMKRYGVMEGNRGMLSAVQRSARNVGMSAKQQKIIKPSFRAGRYVAGPALLGGAGALGMATGKKIVDAARRD